MIKHFSWLQETPKYGNYSSYRFFREFAKERANTKIFFLKVQLHQESSILWYTLFGMSTQVIAIFPL